MGVDARPDARSIQLFLSARILLVPHPHTHTAMPVVRPPGRRIKWLIVWERAALFARATDKNIEPGTMDHLRIAPFPLAALHRRSWNRVVSVDDDGKQLELNNDASHEAYRTRARFCVTCGFT